MISINDHKETFLKWVGSCTEEYHVDILEQVVGEFILERFSGKYVPEYPKVDKMELDLIVNEILYELSERKLIIKRLYFQSLPSKSTTIPASNTHIASNTSEIK